MKKTNILKNAVDTGYCKVNEARVPITNWHLVLGETYSVVLTFDCAEWLESDKIYEIHLIRSNKEFSQSFRISEAHIDSDGDYKYKAVIRGRIVVNGRE